MSQPGSREEENEVVEDTAMEIETNKLLIQAEAFLSQAINSTKSANDNLMKIKHSEDILKKESFTKKMEDLHNENQKLQKITCEFLSVTSLINFLASQADPFEAKKELSEMKLEGSTIFIPSKLLSPNKLHDRFQGIQRNEVMIIKNGLNEKLMAMLDVIYKADITEARHYFIHGPLGIGKSFTLAYSILEARKNGKENKVFYWNNPGEFDWEQFLREYFYTLQFEQFTTVEAGKFLNEIERLFQFHLQNKTWNDLWKQLEVVLRKAYNIEVPIVTLMELLNDFGKPLIIIIDQAPIGREENATLKNLVLKLLEKPRKKKFSLILCSSRLPPDNWDRWFKNEEIISVQGTFKDAEANEFLSLNLKPADWNKNHETGKWNVEVLDYSRDITKNIPFNLSVLCTESYKCEPYEKSQLYSFYFTALETLVKSLHSKFDRSRVQEQKKIWITVLTQNYLKIPIDSRTVSESDIDQNISAFKECFTERGNAYYSLVFYHPFNRTFALNKYWQDICEVIKNDFEEGEPLKIFPILKFKAITKGDIIEKYCCFKFLSIANNKTNNSWNVITYSKDGTKRDRSITFRVQDTFSVLPHAMVAKLSEELENPHNIVDPDGVYTGSFLIPDSEVFRAINLLFIDSKKKVIFPIQITCNIETHDKADRHFYDGLNGFKNKSSTVFDEFMQEVQRMVAEKGYTIQFIWLGLANGNYHDNFSGLKLGPDKEEVNDKSWIVLINETNVQFNSFSALKNLFEH